MIAQEEAVEGRERMIASPNVLWPSLRGTSVQPPFSNSQIDEHATRREVLRIYRTSREETKEMYDLGYDPEQGLEQNWVIRWMLWHVFRYRDRRNHHRGPASPQLDGGEMNHRGSRRSTASSDEEAPVSRTRKFSHQTNAIHAVVGYPLIGHAGYWDPIRNRWYNMQTSQGSGGRVDGNAG